MKAHTTAWFITLILIATGCQMPGPYAQDRAVQNAWMVRATRESAINKAIVLQHTIYSYHFELNGPALNELGRHDVQILASHYKEVPGQLNVPRGDAVDELYAARVAAVFNALAEAGVDKNCMTISSTALPGGAGMSSERVLVIHRSDGQTPASARQRSASYALNQGDLP